MKISKKEKRWIKEGIPWRTEDVRFAKRDDVLVVERKQFTLVHGSPTEFLKKIGLVEDGITQDDLNKAFVAIEKSECYR